MNLYALLIGINDYPGNPLSQCVNDVKKVSQYLSSLKTSFSQVQIETLLDKAAGKNAIIEGIEKSFSRATDDDVCLLYYSGHGAQEVAGGRFPEEHDGLLECLVPYHEMDQETGYLLADIEIRFLLSGLKTNPHLVTIFDCCHSGDIVRAMGDDETEGRRRRLVKIFPARDYSHFIFNSKVSEKEIRESFLSELIPYKNHIHLAACLSNESSWEDREGGVFTRYLIQLLKANENRLKYQEITKWARISLKDITSRKQTPTFSVQGTGKISAASTWLNLYPEDDTTIGGKLVYNKKSGWNYTRGLLMGVKKGLPVTVFIDKKNSFESVIKSSGPEFSLIDDPIKNGIELNLTREYEVSMKTSFTKPAFFVNDLERETAVKSEIERFIKKSLLVNLVSESSSADYFINIFNQMVYISLPGDEFRPLAQQIDLLNHENDYLIILKNQLTGITRWHHFFTLSNPDNNFDKSPLKVELSLVHEETFYDITDAQYSLDPENYRDNKKQLYKKFRIRITNISSDNLYVGVLVLNSDFSITSGPFDDQVVMLQPGQSKFFYYYQKSISKIALDKYKEVYNWNSEWFHYKFIVNNFADFTTSLSDFRQPGLENPLLPDFFLGIDRGIKSEGGAYDDPDEITERWGTLLSTIYLKNPGYNVISAELEEFWDNFSTDDRIAPFIGKLYFDTQVDGLSFVTKSKPNRLDQDQATRGFWNVKINIANLLDNKRRKRIFQRARKKMPELPVVIAEGDSWFLYPFLVKDTIDYVSEEFPVRSLAAAGDTLENYKKFGQLLKETPEIKPEFVLISGGGNDIIGPEIVGILKKNSGENLEPLEYLNENYQKRREKLKGLYSFFFSELNKFDFVKHIFVHGYDYVMSDHTEKIIHNGWVNKYMIKYGIKNSIDRARLIRFLVDNFNSDLEALTGLYNNVTYLNMRGLVNKDEWYDEIHPNDTGFAKVGLKFIQALKTFKTIEQ